MTTQNDRTAAPTPAPAPPGAGAIKAVPARHPGRWVGAAVVLVIGAMFVHMVFTNKAFRWRFMLDNMFGEPVLIGARTVILITVLSMIFGVAIGILVAIMRLSPNPVLSGCAWIYTWFFRAIPRYVLLFVVGNLGVLYARIDVGLPFDWWIGRLIGLDLHARFLSLDANTVFAGLWAGVIGLSLSEGAYMAEIVRAGIKAVDAGQSEAAAALGMPRALTLRRIVLPQALRVIVPPTGNEAIAMLKDTSLLAAVPVTQELLYQLNAIGNRTFRVLPMLVAACLWYLAMASVLMVGQYFLERRFGRGFDLPSSTRRPVGGMGGA